MTSVWIDLRKAKAMLSNTTFKEVKVYEAFSEERTGMQEFIDKRIYDAAVKKLAELRSETLAQQSDHA
jgi:hypothetical protein